MGTYFDGRRVLPCLVCPLYLLCTLYLDSVGGAVLTPPYFNIAERRRIEATHTCGEGVERAELYCKLVGANQDSTNHDNILIQGQVCDECDPTRPDKAHPAEHAIDGSENFWMSPPLSRGTEYNQVNLTITLGQEFHVAYVLIKMGNSPRPGVWALERSADNGKTYKPWQYFADTQADCEQFFGIDSLHPITEDDSVVCDTTYSRIVPLEGGEIVVSLLNNRPSANDFFNSSVLQEWTRATNVRLRLVRTKTLLGHLMSVARQDPTVTRRYFYSIKDISIGGRCRCNGHADLCDIPDENDQYKLLCRCQHNTCGDNCERCCDNMVQKAWQQSKANKLFLCEPCNCFGHSEQCTYNETVDALGLSQDIQGRYEGGGVCQNCRDNTQGINCNECKPGFYRPYGRYLNDTNACEPCNCDGDFYTGNCEEGTGQCECKSRFTPPNCDSCNYGYFGFPKCEVCLCNLNGTLDNYCEPILGSCPCKQNFKGKYCAECSEGFYNFPNCLKCDCSPIGSLNDVCDVVSGECECNSNYGGNVCDRCANGYYNFPQCSYCNCDVKGTEEEICHKSTGQCLCKEGFGGPRCDLCLPGFSGYPDCKPCGCSEVGSTSKVCDIIGKCPCLANFAGKTCDQCVPGYYSYPDCLPCNCDPNGAAGVSCNNEGQCECKSLFGGKQCENCREGLFNFPLCEECNCHPAGVMENFPGCGNLSRPGELCQCKPRIQGRICDECSPLYWNLQLSNPEGCEDCECYLPGVLGGIAVCDSKTGQCICKPSTTSRKCDICSDGMYDLQDANLFGCSDCGCDIGGSMSNICNKLSGQCSCQPRITGRTCNEPLQAHYFPTLHQFQYEAEDGTTSSNTVVRYGFEEKLFPGFSWKGYAVFSQIQNHIIQPVYIAKPSLYRLILRYINPNDEAIAGDIIIIPENPSDEEQHFQVVFKPNRHSPAFVVVAGLGGGIPSPLVMNPGKWDIHIKNERSLFLDYFVLMPAAYYEGNILVDEVTRPCTIGFKGLCRDFRYPTVNSYDSVSGTLGYLERGDNREPAVDKYDDEEHIAKLELEQMPLITYNQPDVKFDLPVKQPGAYVLLVNYLTPRGTSDGSVITVNVKTRDGEDMGKFTVHPCEYTWACRQVIVDKMGEVATFDLDSDDVQITLMADKKAVVGIGSIVAVPHHEWSLDFIKPNQACIMKDQACLESHYPTPLDFKKVEVESGNDLQITQTLPVNVFDPTVKLVHLNDKDPFVEVPGKVPYPSTYVIVVHYYQPDYPDYHIKTLLNIGQDIEAQLPVRHCPSNSGCRAVIQQQDGNNRFQLTDNFALIFEDPNDKSVWLDYVILIPADKFSDRLITEDPVDKTGIYLKECGQNHFFMNSSSSEFCKSSAFSLTTAYNNGALSCNCDYEGSFSYECEKFGGQCECRENVIGRKCEQCKPGFYGFPDCKPCDCPATALCDTYTGSCVCPFRVIGDLCDQCEPFTFGYHSIVGCEDCDCNPYGVDRGNLQCDLYTGSCSCKENVVGRNCDRCLAGFYIFPYCEPCDCDRRGTTDAICDQNNADCHCKDNVDGLACDVCREGTFNLQVKNKLGCTKCFCFGKSTRCSSSRLYRSQITGLEDWKIKAINITKTVFVEDLSSVPEDVNDLVIGIDLTLEEVLGKVVYFSAPQNYLGSQLKAYGGYLTYSIYCTTGPYAPHVVSADVILYGAGTYLLHFSIEQPAVTDLFTSTVEITETNFVLPNGLTVTREQIMMTLQDLQAIYIRATYWENGVTVRLQNLSLDSTTEEYNGGTGVALSVEQCQCPPNYVGLSCEDCAPGYYRSQLGPYGGFCIPCQCNGHAQTCDKVTGICHDCQHNTYGDHCEKCAVGYHGNATYGTPRDCLICACPLPIASNNFATGCEVSEDGERISCDCVEGYYGGRCESCANGFFGTPERVGETCNRCDCSGNINPEEQGACDSVTGRCIRCLNNTFGESCEICAPGYYGDAVELKNCQNCVCDKCGTAECNHGNGQCMCQPNVEGEKCDRCALHHYGFNSCEGCKPCNCGPASDSEQCEPETGQCRCRPGVTGLTCNKCASGYWNYTSEGCTVCACNADYSIGVGCNPKNGQCECLPGVIGERCDHCPHRWVLKPDLGCFPCDSCIDDILDVIDQLEVKFYPITQDFKSVAATYFTTQRLNFINESVDQLLPLVNQLAATRVYTDPVIKISEELQESMSRLERKTEYALGKASEAVNDDVGKKVKDMNNFVGKAVEQGVKSVNDVINIANSFENAAGIGSHSEFEILLAEAKDILDGLNQASPSYYYEEIEQTQLRRANKTLSDMQAYKDPLDEQIARLENLRTNVVGTLDERLDDLKENTNKAKQQTFEIDKKNKKNRDADIIAKANNVLKLSDEADQILNEAEGHLQNTSTILTAATQELYNLITEREKLNELLTSLNNTIDGRKEDIDDLPDIVRDAEIHADQLNYQALDLERLAKESRYDSTAVEAVKAYKNIVEIMRDAYMTAEEARVTAEKAAEKCEGIDEEASESEKNSGFLYDEAKFLFEDSQNNLAPNLKGAKKKVDNIAGINQEIQKDLQSIENGLPKGPENLDNSETISKANEANEDALKVLADIKTYVDGIPSSMKTTGQLHNDSEEINNSLEQAKRQLNQVNSIVPDVRDLANKLNEKPQDLSNEVSLQLEELRRKIALARELANSIKVGVTFHRNATLELRKPESLPQQGINSKLSLYFKTSEPNGLLFFLGNEKGTTRRARRSILSSNFMALEIENGYLKLIADLGSGAKSIVNDDKRVDDDTWHQAIVERTGKNIKLSIRWHPARQESDKLSVREGVINGTSAILNLDKHSKLFLGGFPSHFKSPNEVNYNSFDGVVEEFVIGNTRIGLWNFEEAANMEGALGRSVLTDTISTIGFRFSGDGFIELDSRKYRIQNQTSITMQFKTFAKEGLMFLSATDDTYLSVEMREGRVLFQFNLGGDDTVTLVSQETYNDGEFHTLEVVRDKHNNANLRVDGVMQQQTEGRGTPGILQSSESLFIGGYPEEHGLDYVTNLNFDGCIDQLQIGTTIVDLNINKALYSVIPGCPDKVASVISFEKGVRGYVKWPKVTAVDNTIELILRFKTSSGNGLLAYALDGLASASLALKDGQLIFRSGDTEVKSESQTAYNDSNWHVVMATLDHEALQLFIDDFESYRSTTAPKPIRLLYGELYFGGVPSSTDAAVAISSQFYGCIGDATFNNVIVNFGNLTEIPGAVVGKCIMDTKRIAFTKPLPPLPPPHRVPSKPHEPRPISPGKKPEIDPESGEDLELFIPTTKRPTTKIAGCELPLYPEYEDPSDTTKYKLGTRPGSRLEYNKFPSRIRHGYEFSIKMKTISYEGIIFFAFSKHPDYIAVYLKGGKVHYSFNLGSGPVLITSKTVVNDGNWHTIGFKRKNEMGILSIDELELEAGNTTGNAKTINVEPPFYVGGVNPKLVSDPKALLYQNVSNSFDGCLSGLTLNEVVMTPRNKVNVIPCSGIEEGIFFHPEGGYVKEDENFKVKNNLRIELEIKPRTMTGLLVSVHGKKDYLILELVDGALKFTVDYGFGELVSTYIPETPFCDGTWHHIIAMKTRHVLALRVDGSLNDPSVGAPRAFTDTNNPLYIGGHPNINTAKGIKSRKPFVGCMKNIVIHKKLALLLTNTIYGNVTIGACFLS